MHIHIRHEVKPGEERVIFVPRDVKALVDAGWTVDVEKSPTRCVPDAEYEKVGANLVASESWKEAAKDTIICGLKELPDNDDPLEHRHIYFAHCYKNQGGWAQIMNKFITGKGMLWDLEFLVDDKGRRIAAFGRAAGVVGMALGILQWCHQQMGTPMTELSSWKETQALVDEVKDMVNKVREAKGLDENSPTTHVVGALGRCGGGACWFAEQAGIKKITRWDMEETKGGGPFPALAEQNILVNCIYLSAKIPPFLTMEICEQPTRNLTVFVDVSCDTTNPNNPFPVYTEATDLFNPVLRTIEGDKPLDVIAIDHLPSLVPTDSSEGFSEFLLPHILDLPQNGPVWARAGELFNKKVEEAKAVL